MKISDTRRSRLTEWLDTHPTPAKEKSYFSQLVSGTASFGEKAARRIERQYGMEDGYLDRPLPSDHAPSSDGDEPKGSKVRALAADDRLETIMRLLPRLTETQKAEIANTMQAMADKNDRLLDELLARQDNALPKHP
ncbi:hypothetical protein [Paraburkholderia terrae]